jgi:PPOX class probable F420-dependent enzyme
VTSFDAETERLLDAAAVARLATIAPDGRPQLVPIVFARSDGALWSPIDGKPKSARPLARVRNIERDPRVALLVDHYEDDWRRIWWLRIEGRASLVRGDAAAEAALRAKYRQYRGAVALYAGDPLLVRIAPERVSRWSPNA